MRVVRILSENANSIGIGNEVNNDHDE